MKHMLKATILIFFMLVCFQIAVAQTVTIGTGTYTNENPFRLFPGSGYGRCATIYSRTEIGQSAPKRITHLAWDVQTAHSVQIPVKISLKHVSNSTFSAGVRFDNLRIGATVVYEGTVSFSSTGWYEFDIDDFDYNNIDNLMILTETNFTGTFPAGIYPKFRYTAAASTTVSNSFNLYNSAETWSIFPNGFRPNLRITLTDPRPLYDFPENASVTVGASTVIVEGGNANYAASQVIPEIQNPGFTPSQSLVLNLLGTGPWTITVNTTAPWGAYHQSGSWHSSENTGGQIVFANISANKDLDLPIVLGEQDPTLPVELSSFTAFVTPSNHVTLSWITQSETNVLGYYVYRHSSVDLGAAEIVSPLIDAGNSSQTQFYSYTDTEIYQSGSYYYWLQCIDRDYSESFYGPIGAIVNQHPDEGETPTPPMLAGIQSIYPNPFNPTTSIRVVLENDSSISLNAYNQRGQLVRKLFEGMKSKGIHTIGWDARNDLGMDCASGVYIIVLAENGRQHFRKVVLSQ